MNGSGVMDWSDPSSNQQGFSLTGFQGFSPSMDVNAIGRQIAEARQLQQLQQKLGLGTGNVAKAIAQLKMKQQAGVNAPPQTTMSQQDAMNYLQGIGMEVNPQNLSWVMSGGAQ